MTNTTKKTIANPPVTKILNQLKIVSETGITPKLMAKKWSGYATFRGAEPEISPCQTAILK